MDLNKNIIARFNSVSEAELELGIPLRHSNITVCCNGKLRTTRGYCWCYEQDYSTYKIKPLNNKKPKSTGKHVYQLLRDKTIIAEFSSALAAYKAISGKTNARSDVAIQACCKGKRKSAYGYFWCYVADYESYQIKLSCYQQKVAQIDLFTNQIIAVYKNLSEAAKIIGSTSSKIGHACRGKRNKTSGYG